MMRRTAVVLASASLLVAACQQQTAAPFGDPRAGERVARSWCADCHALGSEQPTATQAAPPFSAVAERRQADEIRRFLAEQHLPMPTFRLRPEEREDVTAYIVGLRRPQ